MTQTDTPAYEEALLAELLDDLAGVEGSATVSVGEVAAAGALDDAERALYLQLTSTS